MPRKKKEEVKEIIPEKKEPDYGTGMTKINNELMAKEDKGNE